MLSTSDTLAIHELLALYGHVIDERQWSRLEEVFTDDVVFDATAAGNDVVRTLAELRRWWSSDDRIHPLAHHATNIVVRQDDDGVVRVLSKGLGVGYRGRVGSIVYRDVVRLTHGGWRIAERAVAVRSPETIPAPS